MLNQINAIIRVEKLILVTACQGVNMLVRKKVATDLLIG